MLAHLYLCGSHARPLLTGSWPGGTLDLPCVLTADQPQHHICNLGCCRARLPNLHRPALGAGRGMQRLPPPGPPTPVTCLPQPPATSDPAGSAAKPAQTCSWGGGTCSVCPLPGLPAGVNCLPQQALQPQDPVSSCQTCKDWGCQQPAEAARAPVSCLPERYSQTSEGWSGSACTVDQLTVQKAQHTCRDLPLQPQCAEHRPGFAGSVQMSTEDCMKSPQHAQQGISLIMAWRPPPLRVMFVQECQCAS